MNPYDWQRHQPQVLLARPQLAPVVESLRRGGGAFVLGGRGMGKSVFLRHVRREMERSPGVRALLFHKPPAELSVQSCLRTLARELEMPHDGVTDPYELLADYLGRDGAPLLLVLLYDEFDSYAKSPSDPPGRAFFNSLEAARRELARVAILTAGNLGVFLLRDVLGSDFLSRAASFRLSPFGRSELRDFAQPFADRGSALPEDVLDSLYLMAGGHPALTTYGLQELWKSGEIASSRVAEVFGRFQHLHREFLREVQRSFSDPSLSEAPQRALELIWRHAGSVPRADLQAACAVTSGALRLDLADVLDLLQAAGLVRVSGSAATDDPIAVAPLPSILSLPPASSPASPMRERLPRDLEFFLVQLHALGADFFRASSSRRGKQLVPEAVFSAFLSVGLRTAGWQVEREAQSAAGRTDLLLRREGVEERGVVEIKIWGRNDYRDVQRQVESYWTAGTAVGVVVMLTDVEIADWPAAYRRDCLPADGADVRESRSPGSPVLARFSCSSTTADGLPAAVDHFLLRIPRRG